MKLQPFHFDCNWRKLKLAQTLKKNRFKERICKKKSVRALRDALQLPILRKRAACNQGKGSANFDLAQSLVDTRSATTSKNHYPYPAFVSAVQAH